MLTQHYVAMAKAFLYNVYVLRLRHRPQSH